MQRSSVLTWLSIAFFAQLGALLRLALAQLAAVDDHQRSSTLYSNFLGCIVIAAVNAAKPCFDDLDLTPIFTGITAGFCGALTTFSSWNMEIVRWVVAWPAPAVLKAADEIHHFSAFSAVLTELGVSFMGFQIGHLCAEAWQVKLSSPGAVPDMENASALLRGSSTESEPLFRGGSRYGSMVSLPGKSSEWRLVLGRRTSCGYMHGEETPQEKLNIAQKSVLLSPLSAYLGCFTAIVCTVLMYGLRLPAAQHQGFAFIMSFAPVGALLRYLLGLWCNGWLQHFKMGTFFANAGACLVLGLCTVFKAKEQCFASGMSDFGLWWNGLVLGVTFGFCGSLSTMSTLVAQLFEMDIVHSFAYFCVSLLVSQGLLAALLGMFLHTSGATAVCA